MLKSSCSMFYWELGTLAANEGAEQLFARGGVQMPSAGEWSGTLGRGEIPCRRMRSGSYVRAMGDLEDSDDSDSSPKPSPKSTARRQSYLSATQQSLTATHTQIKVHMHTKVQARSHAHLATHAICSDLATWINLSLLCQVRDSEMSQRYGEESCSESMFGDTLPHASLNSRLEEPPDMAMPTCFRSRSHSYLRAIQAGCSQDDDTASLDSDSPPPTVTTVRTYSTSTGEWQLHTVVHPRCTFTHLCISLCW
uniref:Teneurin N-terminal domain-containing protein n=1 Tax=Electrophorus electricus TaxID=8005 RepID=A0A4W4HSN0_ELEEL